MSPSLALPFRSVVKYVPHLCDDDGDVDDGDVDDAFTIVPSVSFGL
jgi:hypothetical protein